MTLKIRKLPSFIVRHAGRYAYVSALNPAQAATLASIYLGITVSPLSCFLAD